MRLPPALLSFALLAFTLAHASPALSGEPPGSSSFWYKLIISIGLVLLGGVFAGLTLGLMGLDELHLRVLSASSDDPVERKNAQKVLRLLTNRRHWVLVIVNESLPIFLDSAVSISLVRRLVIIPQAASVRYGLSIGASCAPIVLGMMYLFAPIAYPIAKLLDWILGANDTHTYKKAELKSFLAFHRQGEEPLRDDEISILNGVLELNNKHVEELMTPMQDVVTISTDRILDHDTPPERYSRIPVHQPGRPMAFVGLLLIKKLSVYDPKEALPVSKFPLSILPEANPSINCFQALDYFQTGRAHLLLLSTTPGIEGGAIGVEIISEEIIDETDRYEDNHSKRRAKRPFNAKAMRGIIEYRGRTSRAGSQSTVPTIGERTPLLSPGPGPGSAGVVEHNPQGADGPTTVEQRLLDGTKARDFVVSPKTANGSGHQYGSVFVGSPSNVSDTTDQ
ncbi:uncharacterized protein B0H18DRAFT_1086437 [Fomitopsis serialis]|uniref:uncharacterized protein n=1 Tax=Fomitopsis serialis TaxID=139415 RepID=UPI002008BC49|nr:uncharacterized protein B0H18DRAFT_1086437 [Neoantrodia serialis]KAH9920335.1 hypothetical protein B0H18DRAFT_1086437 [Neoantrodia serialis]